MVKVFPVTEFDSGDWESFNGAEKFPGQKEPLIRPICSLEDPNEPSVLIVADRNSICYHSEEDGEVELLSYRVTRDSRSQVVRPMTQAVARLFLESLPNTKEEIDELFFSK